jgi:long-chain acyl-CoA synthetase
VIVNADGKNVYPDEVEDLYRENPFIKELSVVGVPDGIGEQVACAVVLDLEHDPALSAAEVTAKVEEHFRKISTDLPIWKRVRGVHFWEGDLPKTAKRSIKRPRGGAEIARLRPQARGDQGGAARRRARGGRSPGCSTRSPPSRGGAAPTCSSAAGSASWASTA